MTDEDQLVKGISNDSLRIMALELSVQRLAITLEGIERRMQRWDEVYYHVFPERQGKDIEFERQLHKLRCPPKADDKKQS
jgi:hypothetical protein